jgi:DNA-binding transcriptional regulator YiaG
MSTDRKGIDMSAIDALLSTTRPQRTALPPPEIRASLRKRQGLIQAQIADALEVKAVTVSSWETGRSEPQGATRELYAELLRRIAQRLGESTDWEGTDDE